MLLQMVLAAVDLLGNREDNEQHDRKCQAVYGCRLLREQIHDRCDAQQQGCCTESHGNLNAPDMEVERELVFLIVAVIAKHEYAQRLQEEAPYNAECIGFAQQIDVAPAKEDGHNLKQRNDVDDA